MFKILAVVILTLVNLFTSAQDIEYVRHVVSILSSPALKGRGYVNKGDKKSAQFIQNELIKNGVQSFPLGYLQHFSFPVNTFPFKLTFRIDGQSLIPGIDYLIASSSPGISGTFKTVYLEKFPDSNRRINELIDTSDLHEKFIITDIKNAGLRDTNWFHEKGVIFLTDSKLSWRMSDSYHIRDFVVIEARRDIFPATLKTITLKIKNRFYPDYISQNIIGYIKGKTDTKNFIVFTAHYDHLGKMGGKTYFPGAHDNGSGVAMVLNLARYYARPENQPDISIAFILFGGEELGLRGSKYYTEHPVFPLEDICFLINLDLVGTGSDGIMVVNGSNLENPFELLTKINEEYKLLKEIKKRPAAPNSDQYFFFEKGVPAFFIYSLGNEYSEYHNLNDKACGLPFTKYDDLFRLMTNFVSLIAK
ncbi:MAG: M28 family peptidase [Bacteroidetes bacterium]|nr:M28 family peptidase [Bacteroidota bacterium]